MKIKISKNKLGAITSPIGDYFFHLVYILPDFFYANIRMYLRHISLNPLVLHLPSMYSILYSVYIHIGLLLFMQSIKNVILYQ